MGYIVRPMTQEDIMQVEAIEKEAFTIPWSAEALARELNNKNLSVYQVLVNENEPGEVLGYSGYWKVLDEAHITNIAVRKDYRGKELGRFIMEMTIKSAISDNLGQITLEVRRSNHIAINLYESFGFVSIGTRKEYYFDTGEDALIMWLHLDKKDQNA